MSADPARVATRRLLAQLGVTLVDPQTNPRGGPPDLVGYGVDHAGRRRCIFGADQDHIVDRKRSR